MLNTFKELWLEYVIQAERNIQFWFGTSELNLRSFPSSEEEVKKE